MKHVVVGVDGSSAGGNALRWAVGVAGRTGAELVALSCFEPAFAELTPEMHDRMRNERRAAVDAWIAPFLASGQTVRGVVRSGDPRSVLTDYVASDRPELVVLGRSGRSGGPGLLHLGSVAEYAAHHLDVGLAVIPSGTGVAFDRIVVGVDGSVGSTAAIAWTAELVRGTDVTVLAVHALPAGPSEHDPEARRDIEAWVGPLVAAGAAVEPVLVHDVPPADAILRAATGGHADLVVVGARGLGGFSGLRVGGVALKVLHRADTPLVVLPPR